MEKHGKHRPLVKLIALLLVLWPAAAHAACRQALSLGLDVSGSVDKNEYSLQIHGLANALLAEDVQKAFLAIPEAPVRLQIFIWAGQGGPRTLIDWLEIKNTEDLKGVAKALQEVYRRRFSVETSLGYAMLYGANELNLQTDCWRRTLDISGDGKSNTGLPPEVARNAPELSGITVNGLVIGSGKSFDSVGGESELQALAHYYRSRVIRGPDAFVIEAENFDDFERAMIEKLLKELQLMVVSGTPMVRE